MFYVDHDHYLNNSLPGIHYLFVKAQGLCKIEDNVLFAKIVPQSLSILAFNVLLTTIDYSLTITRLIPDVLQSFIMVHKANLIMLREFFGSQAIINLQK